MRNAVFRKDVGPRQFLIGYVSRRGEFGHVPVTVEQPLEDMRDVLEVQAELRKQGLIPATATVLSWSPFDVL